MQLIKPYVVSDIDGVVIDSKALVIEAYRRVGVEVPEDAWGKPWYEWLKDPKVHKAKQVEYLRMLRDEPFSCLPAARDLYYMKQQGINIGYLTGASNLPAQMILVKAGLLEKDTMLGTSLTTRDKIAALALLAATREFSITYVDDLVEVVVAVHEALPFVQALHYDPTTDLTEIVR